MKKIILLIIILVFLTGCGIFNLDGWIVPDDEGFFAVVEELDTPEKISNYMAKNFTYEAHHFYILTPYELYLIKKGDCEEFSNFAKFIGNYHNFKTYQIKIFYKGTFKKHIIAVFIEDSYFSFVDFSYYFFGFNTFKEIVDFNERYMIPQREWKKYIVYDYWNNIIEKGYNN